MKLFQIVYHLKHAGFGAFIFAICNLAQAQTMEVHTNMPWTPLPELLKKLDNVPWPNVQQEAEKGNPLAQHYLGYCYMEGRHIQQDPNLGKLWYLRAMNNGYVASANNLGLAYQRGLLGRVDLSQAVYYFTYSAQRGFIQAELNLGLLYESNGQADKAFQSYQTAADQDLPGAMIRLFLCYENGIGVGIDDSKAMEWLKKAANAGDPEAEYRMGYRCEAPPDDHPDMIAALKWFRLAADQDWPGGKYELGRLYLEGQGVYRDEEKGMELVRSAADDGLEEAIVDLADLYAQGIGEPRSEQDRPIKLLECAKKYDKLIFRYEHGVGTERDLITAALWYCQSALGGGGTLADKVEYQPPKGIQGASIYQGWDLRVWVAEPSGDTDLNDEVRQVLSHVLKAAEGNGSEAMLIGNMYLTGQDNPVSPTKAWVWFNIAAKSGSASASLKISEAQADMTPKELAEAQLELTALTKQLVEINSFLAITSTNAGQP
jgi:TPR repeat protein